MYTYDNQIAMFTLNIMLQKHGATRFVLIMLMLNCVRQIN